MDLLKKFFIQLGYLDVGFSSPINSKFSQDSSLKAIWVRSITKGHHWGQRFNWLTLERRSEFLELRFTCVSQGWEIPKPRNSQNCWALQLVLELENFPWVFRWGKKIHTFKGAPNSLVLGGWGLQGLGHFPQETYFTKGGVSLKHFWLCYPKSF